MLSVFVYTCRRLIVLSLIAGTRSHQRCPRKLNVSIELSYTFNRALHSSFVKQLLEASPLLTLIEAEPLSSTAHRSGRCILSRSSLRLHLLRSCSSSRGLKCKRTDPPSTSRRSTPTASPFTRLVRGKTGLSSLKQSCAHILLGPT